MPTTRTKRQRTQVKELNKAKKKNALRYAFSLSPYIHKLEAEGFSTRQIVEILNHAGAVVPSEYTGGPHEPQPVKEWTLVQYQRFRKRVAEANEKMAFYAKLKGRSHVRPYGDGAGLFEVPLFLMDRDPNRKKPAPARTFTLQERSQRAEAALAAFKEMLADPVRRRVYDDVMEERGRELDAQNTACEVARDRLARMSPEERKRDSALRWARFTEEQRLENQEQAERSKAFRKRERENKKLSAARRQEARAEFQKWLAEEAERMLDPAYRRKKNRQFIQLLRAPAKAREGSPHERTAPKPKSSLEVRSKRTAGASQPVKPPRGITKRSG